MNTTRKPYPTDLTDQEGQLIEPRLPKRIYYNTKPKHPPRNILNAIFYLLATGCPHAPPRLSPLHHRFIPLPPCFGSVSGSRSRRGCVGRFACLQHLDWGQPDGARRLQRGVAQPRQAMGYDAAQKTVGRKPFLAVDSLGLVWGVYLASAHRQEVYGGLEGLACEAWWRVCRVYVEGGYRGLFERLSWGVLGVEVWVVPQLTGSGCVVFVKGWVVERVLSWLSGVRCLCRDYEARVESRACWLYGR